MKFGDRSWMKPKSLLRDGRYVLDRWGRLLPATRANREKAVALVRVENKRGTDPRGVPAERAVARIKELIAEGLGGKRL